MNKIIDKFKKLTDASKMYLVFGLSTLLVLVVGIIGVSMANTDSGYLGKQEEDGLVFDKANLEYFSGVTKFTVQVNNTNSEDYSLNTISVTFSYGDKEHEELIGYIGNTIKKGETKLLDVSIDKEIRDIINIKYDINK